ncbi:MAG: ATP-binding protein [Acidimicrobiales bacterium]
MTDIRADQLYLGGLVDPATHQRLDGEPAQLDPADLTTHGVIVGMTGSGKTGLGVVLIEEALLQGIPTLVIDPKGDMGNLLLTFPGLAPGDFEPWVDPSEAQRAGTSVAELAAETARSWREGLASWGVEPARIQTLRDTARLTIYTPGSRAGTPLNLVGSLAAPKNPDDLESTRDEIEGFVTSLLAMVGVDADPLASPEHILLANLIEDAWSKGVSLDLAGLLGLVQDPPLRKIGIIDLDTFMPAKARTALLLKLNGLLASPSFAAWSEGPALDVASLLWDPAGRPSAAVVTLAHLSDEERQFVVTLLLAKLVTWMRAQPGAANLRALVYMDEVFGYVPPVAAPPAKKPILTILKQARAFGVGLVLATQNPVDLDYKAISNAGTWLIGRLQTERDKARLLEGMASAAGGVDTAAVDATISGLAKREFVLHSAKASAPRVFTTRWAMSYLRGPLTRDQIGQLTEPPAEPTPAAPAGGAAEGRSPQAPAAAGPLGADETTLAPEVAEGVPVYHLDPAAPWAAEVGASSGAARLRAGLVTRVQLLFDDEKADVRVSEEWEAVVFPLAAPFDPTQARPVDYDPRDFRSEAPPGATYVLPDAPIKDKAFFRQVEAALKTHLLSDRFYSLPQNKALKLYGRPGESAEQFAERCRQAAQAAADAEADKIRTRLQGQMDRVRNALTEAQYRVDQAEAERSSRRTNELLAGAGALLSSFLGGRRSSRSIASAIRGAGSRRGQSSRAAASARAAADRVADKADELAELERELADALGDIDAEWDEKAAAIEVLEVNLEKADITVQDVAIVWAPTA